MTTVASGHDAIRREIAAAIDLLSEVSDWSIPTRLEGWSVADLAGHVAWGQAMQSKAWRQLHPGGEEPPEVNADAGRDAVLDAIKSSHEAFMGRLMAASDDDLGRELVMPYGTLPAALVLQIATMEAGVHRSDIAVAAGADGSLAADVVAVTLALLPGMCSLAGATATERPPEGTSLRVNTEGLDVTLMLAEAGWQLAHDGDATPTATITGSPEAVVLFALGRVDAGAVEIAGDTTLGNRFKTWFPGP